MRHSDLTTALTDRTAKTFLGILFGAVLIVALLNLLVPAESGLHVSSYTVSLLGKYLCYALLALALDLPQDFFDDFCQQPLSTLRLLHYPPQPPNPEPGEKGCGAHTDFGGVTILLLDDNPGLQGWDAANDRWINAEPIPGTFVVNLGDMIARWTNDRYRSTLHRVVNTSGAERYSVPFFYSGNPDHEVSCLPSCLTEGDQPHHPPTTVETHLMELYRWTFA